MPVSQVPEEEERLPREVTRSFGEVMGRAIDSKLYDMRVCLPAEVMKYDPKKQSIDAQPLLKSIYRDKSVLEMPPIFNIPVIFPRAGQAFIALPLKKGDSVTLIFSDRSLDKWKSVGGKVNPEDVRKHDLSDALALVGGYSFKQAVEIANDQDIIIKNQKLEIRVKPNGHLEILNQAYELVKVLSKMLKTIREAVVYTSNGPQKLKHLEFAQVQKQLDSFVEK